MNSWISTLPELSLRQKAGVVCLVISTVSWLAVPVIAFLDMSVADRLGLAGISYAVSIATWWLCLPLLGRELIALGRHWWLKMLAHVQADRQH